MGRGGVLVKGPSGAKAEERVSGRIVGVAWNQVVYDDRLMSVGVARYRPINDIITAADTVVDVTEGERRAGGSSESHARVRLRPYRAAIAHHHHSADGGAVRIGAHIVTEGHRKVAIEGKVKIR